MITTNTRTVSPHVESRKREKKMRTPEGVKALPVDLKNSLSRMTGEFGYENEWYCLLQAARYGLIVMDVLNNKVAEIINNLQQIATR